MIAQLLSRPDQNEPVFEIVKDPDVHFPSRGKDALHDLREDTGRQGEPEGVKPVLSCPTLEHKPWERSVSKKDRDINVSVLQVDHCKPILGLDASDNGWAKPLTVSPNNPAWEMGASRKRALSVSFISARLSQRWHSWTTRVDIAFSRDRAVTFVAQRAKSVGVRSSCINPWSVLPLNICFRALAWCTCRIVMHTRQRRPGLHRCMLWPRERASLYNLWTGDADDSSKWRRFAFTSAPQTTLSSWVMS